MIRQSSQSQCLFGTLAILNLVLLMVGQSSAAVQGTVAAWGNNEFGQIAVPGILTGVSAIAAGPYHNLALKRNGSVVAWGWNEFGQSSVPTDLSGVVAIAAGFYQSVALRGNGTVVAWGNNDFGQTTVPGNLSGVIAIATGADYGLALKGDGTVVAWGNNSGLNIVPTNLFGIVAIAAGYLHNLALDGNGTVVAWGRNDSGQSRVPNGLNGVTSIAAGSSHSLALKSDGTVVAWGDNTYGQSRVPTNLTGVMAIAAGGSHSLALKTNGTVVAWGYNNDGQSTVPVNLSGVSAIGAGNFHSLALLDSAPIGAPAVFVDGMLPTSLTVYVRGSASISLTTSFANGTMLFTLDGSTPDIISRFYDGPFIIKNSVMLRAIAYNADFMRAVLSDPVRIVVQPTLSATIEGGGNVTVIPPAGAYLSGGRAVITAAPAPGWTFLHWLGDQTGTNPSASVFMTRNKCVQAVFGTVLSNTVVGIGSVVRSPAAELYPYGTPVRLTAVPQAGNYFVLWGNAATGTNNPLTFAVTNANPTVTAVFAGRSFSCC